MIRPHMLSEMRILLCVMATLATARPAVTQAVRFRFPLAGGDPFSSPVSALFDHSIADASVPRANTADGVIRTFWGELARRDQRARCGVRSRAGGCGAWEYARVQPPYQSPNAGPMYGYTNSQYLSYDGHAGYDFAIRPGATVKIISAADGFLSKAVADPVNGQGTAVSAWNWFHTVIIDHSDGLTTWYLHLATLDPKIEMELASAKAVWVTKGQEIGIVGGWAYGRSDGLTPHLHFEVRQGGADAAHLVDPYQQQRWDTIYAGHYATEGGSGGPFPAMRPTPFLPFPADIRANEIRRTKDWDWLNDLEAIDSPSGRYTMLRRCSGDRDFPTCLVNVMDHRDRRARWAPYTWSHPTNYRPLAFVGDQAILYEGSEGIVRTDLSTWQRSIFARGSGASAAWKAPMLAYVGAASSPKAIGIWIASFDGRFRQKVAELNGADVFDIVFTAWTMDDATLYVPLSTEAAGHAETWAVNVDGSGTRKLGDQQIFPPTPGAPKPADTLSASAPANVKSGNNFPEKAVGRAVAEGVSSSDSMAGSYSLRSVNGQSLPYILAKTTAKQNEWMADIITFSSDGTYIQESTIRSTAFGIAATAIKKESGTWTRSGTEITLRSTSNSRQPSATATFSDGTMTLVSGGVALIYKK